MSGPHVSIITSCITGPTTSTKQVLDRLSQRGEEWFDLYVFQEKDSDLLREACQPLHEKDLSKGKEGETEPEQKPLEPPINDVIRQMNPSKAAKVIRTWLPPEWQARCGTASSPIRGLATNIPDLSDPDQVRRQAAVDMVFNCALLARELGATCVEIVGGPAFNRGAGANEPVHGGSEVVRQRLDCLRESLRQLDNALVAGEIPVGLALEIEPGIAYLLNDLKRVEDLFNSLGTALHIGLNVDVGHLLLLDNDGKQRHETLHTPKWIRRIQHFHISDHSIGHFCDLELNTFHNGSEYSPWIKLFVEVLLRSDRNQFFTETMSVELEACPTSDQAIRSARILRAWIGDAVRNHSKTHDTPARHRMAPQKAVVMFVDIVSSTQLVSSLPLDRMAEFLCAFVHRMERRVSHYRGFFDKFTGDGIMAVFPISATCPINEVVQNCIDCASHVRLDFRDLFRSYLANSPAQSSREFEGMRIGIACGEVYFGSMNSGLRAQVTAVGETVIRASRVMGVAEGDQILVDEEIATQAMKFLHYELLGERALTGLPGMIRVFELKGVHPQPLARGGGDDPVRTDVGGDTDSWVQI